MKRSGRREEVTKALGISRKRIYYLKNEKDISRRAEGLQGEEQVSKKTSHLRARRTSQRRQVGIEGEKLTLKDRMISFQGKEVSMRAAGFQDNQGVFKIRKVSKARRMYRR